MDQGQGAADDQTGNLAERLTGGHAQDRQDEDAGQHDLGQEAAADGDAGLKGVRAEAAVKVEENAQADRTEDRAEALGDHVADEVLEAHLLADQHCQRDRRVDVAAGNVADGVGHRYDHKAEGQSRERVAAPVRAAGDDRHAAGHQHEDKGTDEFRQILFECVHIFPS